MSSYSSCLVKVTGESTGISSLIFENYKVSFIYISLDNKYLFGVHYVPMLDANIKIQLSCPIPYLSIVK